MGGLLFADVDRTSLVPVKGGGDAGGAVLGEVIVELLQRLCLG